MATNRHHHNVRARLVTLVAASVAATAAWAAAADARLADSPAGAARITDSTRCGGAVPHSTAARAAAGRPRRWSYDWPLRPFRRQHPVRGFFNDPRESVTGSDSFHFGIDISAPDGTAVYAVAAGKVYVPAAGAVAVAETSGRVLAYWHIVPVVRDRQSVARHQLLGHIAKGWGHVHFAESRGGEYVNPLRPGGIGPYDDTTVPTVARMRIDEHNHGHEHELVVDAFDTTPLRIAAPWNDMPVTPALIRWRLVGPAGATPWRIGVDSRLEKPENSRFWDVYARDTRKNHPPLAGRYCFRVARWDSRSLRSGRYRVQVAVSDTAGNRTIASRFFTVG